MLGNSLSCPTILGDNLLASIVRNILPLLLVAQLSTVCANASEIELGGLILDNTFSRQGHEFTNKISAYWRELPNTGGKNLVVKEIVVPQAGTKVSVIFDNRIVYQTYFGRRQVAIEERVQQAMYLVIDAVANAQFESSSPEFAADEW